MKTHLVSWLFRSLESVFDACDAAITYCARMLRRFSAPVLRTVYACLVLPVGWLLKVLLTIFDSVITRQYGAVPPPSPIQGWSNIANHFRISARTAQLWEADWSLPVHRTERGCVWVDPLELATWKLRVRNQRSKGGPRVLALGDRRQGHSHDPFG